MMEKNLVAKLVDFLLENDSPAVTIGKAKRRQPIGSNYAVPPLENLLGCLSYIARMQTHVDLDGLLGENHAGPSFGPKHSFLTLNVASQNAGPPQSLWALPPLHQDDRFMLS